MEKILYMLTAPALLYSSWVEGGREVGVGKAQANSPFPACQLELLYQSQLSIDSFSEDIRSSLGREAVVF